MKTEQKKRDKFPATVLTGKVIYSLYISIYMKHIYFKLTVKYMSIYT